MTRVTFAVSASLFVANMCIKQNAANLVKEFPLAAVAAEESFYVDDGLIGADNVETVRRSCSNYLLREVLYCTNGTQTTTVLEDIQPEMNDVQGIHISQMPPI